MAYSTSRKTLDKQLPNLQYLEAGKACVWRNLVGKAPWFSYKIREALYIAKLYPESYPNLAKAADAFRIEVVDANTVQAVLSAPYGGTGIIIEGTQGQTAVNQIADATKPYEKMGKQTAASIIESWLKVQPSNTIMSFPQANLEPEDLIRLHKWASAQGWIFFEADGAITLQRETRDLKEFSWSPDDLSV